MMFVDVTNFKSALAVENILTPYKKGRLSSDKKTRLPKEPITPEICMEVLQSTNYARNIKDMLLCIAELSPSEQARFKDIVLSVFSNREQPNDILILGKKLAHAAGYEAALNEALKFEKGDALASLAQKGKIYVTYDKRVEKVNLRDYQKLLCLREGEVYIYEHSKMPPVIEAPYSQKLTLANVNLEGVQKIVPQNGGEVKFTKVKNEPAGLDVSASGRIFVGTHDADLLKTWKCARENLVYDVGYYYLRGEIDLTLFDEVGVYESTFDNEIKLKLRDGGKLTISHTENVPQGLDTALCAELKLLNCDLKNRAKMVFRSGGKVDLSYCSHLPEELDFSACDEVALDGCDLEYRRCPRFKKGAKVSFVNAKHLPENIDLSECADVNLSYCDAGVFGKDAFKSAKRLILAHAVNLPEDIDFSNCAILNLEGCDLKNQAKDIDFSGCSVLNLEDCDLKNQTHLRFGDNAKVQLRYAKAVPENTDFSPCRAVDLKGCRLVWNGVARFGDKAKVNLESAKISADVLDVSACDKVSLELCDISGVRKIIFRDGAQAVQSKVLLPKSWGGEFVMLSGGAEAPITDKKEDEPLIKRLVGKFWAKGGRG